MGMGSSAMTMRFWPRYFIVAKLLAHFRFLEDDDLVSVLWRRREDQGRSSKDQRRIRGGSRRTSGSRGRTREDKGGSGRIKGLAVLAGVPLVFLPDSSLAPHAGRDIRHVEGRADRD
jgi:hypothetical protein